MPQVRVGWRSGAVSPVVSVSKLLDSYSGAAAAYSLRKLNSSYTGSAIRVRRSSDNTELNIGFDSDGNLDTYALSSFVGTGNGFVTTWYDQSGNGREATQTTAGNQPQIVSNGVVNTFNSKPCVKFDGNGDFIQSAYGGGTTNEMYFVTQTTDNMFIFPRGDVGMGFIAEQGSSNSLLTWSYGSTQLYVNSILTNPTNRNAVYNLLNGYKLSLHKSANLSSGFGYLRFGNYNLPSGDYDFNGNLFEWIIYPTLQSSQSSIESNINSYYSIYPNPTSVWNLLAAAYNADTKSLPSLKTSLVASYNGESNANDSFGGNNGTAQGGLTYGTGKIGNAFTGNGTNAYVSLPTNSFKFTNSQSFSISTWVYITNASTVNQIFSSVLFNGSQAYGWALRTMPYSSTQCNIDFITDWLTGTGTPIPLSVNNAFPINTWAFITATRNGSTGVEKVYVNGSQLATRTITPNYLYTSNTIYPSVLANSYNSSSTVSYLNGKVDALNIWQKELTASEITELYNSGNGAQYITDDFYKPTTNDALLVNNGTAQGGLTYGLGKVGTAFQFNGTNAYASLSDNSLNINGAMSFSFWIKTSNTTDYTIILGNVQGARTPYGFQHGWMIWLSAGKIQSDYKSGTNISAGGTSVSSVANNTWNHVTVTYNPANPTTGDKIYINGVLDKTSSTLDASGSSSIHYTSPMKPCIGARNQNGTPSNFLSNGTSLDAVNIWQKELTQSEITELYNSGNGKQYPN